MKYFYYVLSLLAFACTSYLIFLAINQDEGILAFVCRLIAALVFLTFTLLIFKERHITKKQQLVKWLKKDRPEGFWYYVLVKGGIGWGITVGYITWVYSANFSHHDHLLASFAIYMVIYLIGGFFFGWFMWHGNVQRAKSLGFDLEK